MLVLGGCVLNYDFCNSFSSNSEKQKGKTKKILTIVKSISVCFTISKF